MLTPPPRPTLFPYTTLFRSYDCPTLNAAVASAQVKVSRSAASVAKAKKALKKAKKSGSSSKVKKARKKLKSAKAAARSEEHTSELQSHSDLVCRLLLEKKKQ